MANIIDYMKWRGDVSFESSPLNEVDNLIFSNLTYIHFEKVAKCSFSNGIKLSILIDKFLKKYSKYSKIYRVKEDISFLKTIRNCDRYKDLKIYGIVNSTNTKEEVQFSALTIEIDKILHFISFGGTDLTIAGWKEDFNLSYNKEVLGQKYASFYINYFSKHFKGKLYIGGHSKGGNLSIYAAVKCNKQNSIINIYNNDGPNLSEITDKRKYDSIKNKIIKIVPEESIIGMFFDNTDKLTVIESNTVGILQHEIYTWQLIGNKFLRAKSLSKSSKIIRKSLREWLNKMNISQREIFVNTIYKLFGKGKIEYVYDLLKGKNIFNNFQAFINLTEKERNLIGKFIFNFFKILIKNSIIK